MTTAATFPPQASMVRRTDVALRALYPQLETRIFEITPHRYQIVFDRELLEATIINECFRRSVRPAGTWIDLANQVPSSFLRELPRIDDRALSVGLEGFPFTTANIETILLCRYPDLSRLVTSPNEINPITLLFDRVLTADQEAKVRAFMAGCLPNWPIAIGATDLIIAISDESQTPPGEVVIEVRPSCLRPHMPPFVREDEAFWFENLDALFEGRLRLDSFSEIASAGTSCYLGRPSFRQIDLRQAVLLYDTVYSTPPLTDMPGVGVNFWEEQAVTREDVLRLLGR